MTLTNLQILPSVRLRQNALPSNPHKYEAYQWQPPLYRLVGTESGRWAAHTQTGMILQDTLKEGDDRLESPRQHCLSPKTSTGFGTPGTCLNSRTVSGERKSRRARGRCPHRRPRACQSRGPWLRITQPMGTTWCRCVKTLGMKKALVGLSTAPPKKKLQQQAPRIRTDAF